MDPFDILSEATGALVAHVVRKTGSKLAPTLEPHLALLRSKASGPISAFWRDFRPVLDNPFGLLWVLTGFSILALAVWGSFHPATVPTATLAPLMVVFSGFIAYFAWRGVKRRVRRTVRKWW